MCIDGCSDELYPWPTSYFPPHCFLCHRWTGDLRDWKSSRTGYYGWAARHPKGMGICGWCWDHRLKARAGGPRQVCMDFARLGWDVEPGRIISAFGPAGIDLAPPGRTR